MHTFVWNLYNIEMFWHTKYLSTAAHMISSNQIDRLNVHASKFTIINMNIQMTFWIWFCKIIVSTYVEKMDRKNLFKMAPSTMPYKDTMAQKGQTFIECKRVQVTNINRTELNHDKLYIITMKVGKDPRYKSKDRLACTRIRKSHLNIRDKRGGKRLKHHTHRVGLLPEGADSSNLIHIKQIQ